MSRRSYPAAFRAEIVRLVRSGRTPEELAKRFEPTAQTIRNWANAAGAQAAAAYGEDLTGEEREELKQLRRRVKQLEEEREILHRSAVRSCLDNAVAGSFLAAQECEPIDQPAFRIHDRAGLEAFDLIEGW